MTDPIIEAMARALATSDGIPEYAPLGDYLRNAKAAYLAALPMIAEEFGALAKHQAIISGCKTRKTKNLGLRRDAYFTEIANEVEEAIRALAVAKVEDLSRG